MSVSSYKLLNTYIGHCLRILARYYRVVFVQFSLEVVLEICCEHYKHEIVLDKNQINVADRLVFM